MKNKKIKKSSKKLIKSSKILIGTTTVFGTTTAVVVPIVVSNKNKINDNNKKGKISSSESKDLLIESTQALINEMVNTTKTPPTVKQGSTIKTADQVSADDFIVPTHDGLTFIIKKVEKSTASPDGTTVKVTIKVSSDVTGTNSKTYEIEVNGFISQADLEEIEKISKKLEEKQYITENDGDTDDIRDFANDLTNLQNQAKTKNIYLELLELIKKYKSSLNLTSLNLKSLPGGYTYKITNKMQGDQNIIKFFDEEHTIYGHELKFEILKNGFVYKEFTKKIEIALLTLKTKVQSLNEDSFASLDKNNLPSEVTKTQIKTLEGLATLEDDDIALAPNNDNGTLKVTITNHGPEKVINLSGFETTANQALKIKVQSLNEDSFASLDKNNLPSEVTKENVKSLESLATLEDDDIALAPNNDNGTLKVTITNHGPEKVINLSGFETTANQALKTKVQSLNEDSFASLDKNNLPSEVTKTQIKTLEGLATLDDQDITLTPNNDNGTLKVTITNHGPEKVIDLSGFETTASQALKTKVQSLNEDSFASLDKNNLPSAVTKENVKALEGLATLEDEDITLTPNNDNGTLKVTITNHGPEKVIDLSGFETTANQALKIKVQSLNEDSFASLDKNNLPSEVTKENVKALEGLATLEDDDIALTPSDDNGTLKVTITNHGPEKVINLSGFETTANQALKIKVQSLNEDSFASLDKNNLPSEVTKENVKSLESLATLEDDDITLTPNNDNGTLKVTITNHGPEKVIDLSGFETTASQALKIKVQSLNEDSFAPLDKNNLPSAVTKENVKALEGLATLEDDDIALTPNNDNGTLKVTITNHGPEKVIDLSGFETTASQALKIKVQSWNEDSFASLDKNNLPSEVTKTQIKTLEGLATLDDQDITLTPNNDNGTLQVTITNHGPDKNIDLSGFETTANQALKIKVQSLNEDSFASLDKNNLPSEVTKENVKTLEGLATLEDQDITLAPNNDNGTLQVIITNHGPEKNINLSGFPKKADLEEIEKISKKLVETLYLKENDSDLDDYSDNLRNFANDLTNLQNQAKTKNIYLELLELIKKYKSSLNLTSLNLKSLPGGYTYKITNKMQGDQNIIKFFYEKHTIYGHELKFEILKNGFVYKEFTKKIEIALLTLKTKVQSLNEDSFASLDKTNLPSAVTKENVKALEGLATLEDDDIALAPNNDNGTLKVTITNHGPEKVINLSGFETTANQALKIKVQSLNEDSFASLDKNNLPSAVTKENVKALEGLATLEDDDIALTPNNDNGTLKVTITNHGPEKVINLSGFETTANQALKTKVQSLNEDSFASLDKNNLPSEVTKTQIKTFEGLATLDDQDITLTPNNDNGTLKVTITNHGPEKVINLSGFETTASQALKIKVQSLNEDSFASLDKNNLPSAVTKENVKTLEGLATLEDQDITLAPNNDNGTLQVIITNHGPEKNINLSGFPKKADLEEIEKISKKLVETLYLTENDSDLDDYSDNLRNFANDLTNLQNQAKTKNIYLELLELIKKYKSSLNLTSLNLKSLPGGYTYKITNKMQGDQNIIKFFYEKHTIYGHELKFEILKNGFVYKEFTKKIEIALLTLKIKVQSLNEDSFASLDKTNLPSAVTKENVKTLEGLATLEDDDITLTPNNDNGTLKVTITNHGPEKVINLSGFETTASQALKTKVQSLNEDSFAPLDKTNLPSAVTKTQIKTLEGMATLEDDDIALTPSDDNGTLKVTITNHGPEKVINLSGFETTASQALKTKVQSLNEDSFASLDKNNLPSEVTKTQIKTLEGLATLDDQDITLTPNNDNGTLKVTITNHGPEKVIDLSGFETTASQALKTKVQSLNEDSFASLDKNNLPSAVTKENVKALEGLATLEDDDIALTPNNDNGTLKVTITNHGPEKVIDLSGFETTASQALKIKVQSLNEDSFASLGKNNLPSEVTKTQIKTLEGLATLDDQDITLTPNNDNGTLQVTITNHGPDKNIDLSGFETTASQALKIKVQSLNEDSFVSLDKTNLPSAVTKENVKTLEGLATLEDQDITLAPNNDNGTLQVIITNHGPEKNINLSGFPKKADLEEIEKISKKLVETLYLTENDSDLDDYSDNLRNFANDLTNLQNQAKTKNIYLELLELIKKYKSSLNLTSLNLKSLPGGYTYKITNKMQGDQNIIKFFYEKHTIYGHELKFEILKNGFVYKEFTKKIEIALLTLKTKVQSLNEDSFAPLDKTNLPSAVTKENVKALEGLATLEDDDIALAPNNDNGTLKVTITNHGPEKVINLSGFETTANQALKIKVQSLNEDSFASLDKNNLPSEVTKENVKSLESLATLEDDDIALAPNNDNGTLKVTITNHGPEKVINLSGFETTANQALKTKVQSLNEDSFASLDKNNLPSEVTKTQIKTLEGLATLDDQDITLTPNNDNGTLKVTITNHGPEKVIDLSGFETTASQALKTKVQSLNEDSFASLDKNNLPSAVTKENVKALEGLATLEDEDITLTPNNDNGTLKVTITNHGPEKVIDLSGFETTANQALKIKVQSLNEDSFASLDKNNLPSEVTKENVKALEGLATLEDDDIALTPSDDNGTLKVTITNHGPEKVINLSGFETTANQALKIKVQSLNEDSFASLDKNNLPSEVTKENVKSLESLATLEDDDITLTPNNDNGTLKVTITNHGPEKVIDLSGFETTASQALKIKVQSLNEDSFAPLDKNNLPSAVTKENVKALEGLATLEDDDIALTPNNDNGTLKVTITNHGPDKNIDLSGFETTANQALKIKVQSLNEDSFASLDKNNLPSEVTKENVKTLEGLATLEDQDITLAPNNDNGTLQVIITNHGPEKNINLSGFPKKADLEEIEKISKKLVETLYLKENDSDLDDYSDNLRNFANDLTNLQNQAKTKNIYLELLELIKKYKSSLNLTSLNLKSLPGGYTYKITNKMQGDQNIIKFFYEKHTIYGHELKFEILKNGFVYKEFTKKIEIALLTLKTKVQSLNEDSFASLDKTNLPSAVTKENVKALEGLATLEDDDIALAPNNDNGTLKVTITNHGPEKVINLSGFETTANQALKIKVQSLNEDSFASLDKNNLPSAVTKENVKALEGLATLEDDDIALTPNNDNGTLKVTITNHGPEKVINLSGFETTANQALKTKVQSLNEDSFASLDKNNLPSEVTKTQIKTFEGLATLDDQDITLTPNNDNGTLKVTITNHGPEKVINLSGFETTASQALKIKVQSLNEDSFASLDKNNLPSAVTKENVKTLEGLATLEDQDITLAPNNDNGTLQVIITNHGPEKNINLSGFPKKADLEEIEKISKKLVETLYLTENDSDLDDYSDNLRNFANDLTNLQNQAKTKNIYLELLELIKKYKSSLNLTSLNLKSLPGGYTYKITNKMQGDQNIIKFFYEKHTIYGHELKFEILKNGFVYKEFTKKIEIALLTLKIKVQSLNEDSFASLDKTNLPSAVTKENVKTLEGLATLEDDDITLTPNNDNGTLKVTITNHGPEKVINLSGFETTASQALKTKVQSLNEDSFAPLDKTNLPSAVTKTQIKTLEGMATLEDDDIALTPSDDNGTLKVTITNHGPEKVINLSGFETTASQALKIKVQSLNEDSFAPLDKNNLPSEVTKTQIKTLEGLATLDDQDITLTPNNDNGTLQVTITNHGPDKNIDLSGFETTASQALKIKVQSLNEDSFVSLDKTNLPSAVTKENVKTLEGLATLEDQDITLAPNNDNGTLQVIITNHGPEKNINLSGFPKKADLEEIEKISKKLVETLYLTENDSDLDDYSDNLRNFANDLTNLQNQAKTKNIYLELLELIKKYKSSLNLTSLNLKSLPGGYTYKITNKMQGDQNIIKFFYEKHTIYGHELKFEILKNGFVYKEFTKKIEIALLTLKTKVQSLNEDSFASLDKNNLPSEVTKTQIKTLEGLATLDDQDITLTPNNDNGTLKVTITNHGPEKVIDLSGFETTASQALKTKVQSLNEDSFASLDKNNLPSAVTKENVKALEGLATLEDDDIALTPNNDNGTLKVTITNHGPEKVIDLSGFETTASQALKIKVQSLNEDSFASLDKNNLPSEVTKTQIKTLEGLATLDDQDITLTPNNDNGTLQVTITNHGPDKNIDLSGFETTASQALKIKVQSLNEDSFVSLDKTNLPSAVTKENVKTLEGLATLEDQDITLAPNNDNGTLQVIITNHGPEKNINLSGFPKKADLEEIEKISKKLVETLYLTENDSDLDDYSDNLRNFANDLTNLQNQAKTKNIYLELLELIKKYKSSLNLTSLNLKSLPGGYTYKITNKMQGDQNIIKFFYEKHTIYGHELKFEILKNGFVYKEFTKKIEIALLTLKTKVQSLNEDSFASLDKNNLPSAVTKENVKALEGLATLEDDDIALAPNNDNGTLKVTITNHGPEKVINLSGFKTTAQALATAQTIATNAINNVAQPQEDKTNGDADLFDAIKKAKDKSLFDIQDANTNKDIYQAKNNGLTAIKKAIMVYKQDLANTKLANDKNAKKAAIDNINPQSTLIDGATNPTDAANALAQAKTAAKNAIQNASSSADLSSIFNTQKGKVETARDDYDKAIQAANLDFEKTQEKDAIKEATYIFSKYLEITKQSDIYQAKKIAYQIIDNINVGIDLLPGVELPFRMQYTLDRSKQDAKNQIIFAQLNKNAVIDCLNKNLPLIKKVRDTLKQAIRTANAVKRIFDRPQDANKKPLMLDYFLPKVNNDYQDISIQELKEKFNLEDVPSDYKFRYKVTKVYETKDEVLVNVELTNKIDNSIEFKISFTKKGLPTTSSLISKIWDPRFKTYRDEKSLKLPSESNHKNTTLGFYIKNTYLTSFKDFILSKYTIEISSLNDDKKYPLPLFDYGGLVNWHIPLNNKKWIEILTRIMETRSGIKDFRDIFEINIKNQDMTNRYHLSAILPNGSRWKGVSKFYKKLVFTIIDKSNNKVLYNISLDDFYVINDDPFI